MCQQISGCILFSRQNYVMTSATMLTDLLQLFDDLDDDDLNTLVDDYSQEMITFVC